MIEEIKSNYHTHTFLCKHALGDVEDYVKRAISLNYHTIAITDHGPFTKEFAKILRSRRMSLEQYKEVYLPSIERSIALHKNEIRILKGVEIEYYDELKSLYPKFLEELDIMILGQHYIKIANNEFKSVYSNTFNKDDIKIYTNEIINGLNSGYFKILAHPEIFSWNIDVWDDECVNASKKIIEAAIKNHVVLEYNVNGIRNSYYQRRNFKTDGKTNFPYPRYEFWKLVESYDKAFIIINDDAHAPNRIKDEYTDYALSLIKKLKINLIDNIDDLDWK